HAITSGGDPIEAAALRGLLERDPRAVSRIDHRTPALAGRGLLRLSAPTRDEKVGRHIDGGLDRGIPVPRLMTGRAAREDRDRDQEHAPGHAPNRRISSPTLARW